jgi:hypothetical protein
MKEGSDLEEDNDVWFITRQVAGDDNIGKRRVPAGEPRLAPVDRVAVSEGREGR